MARRGWIETGGAVLDRVEPIDGHGFSGGERRAFQRLGAEPFDRIPVDGSYGRLI
jgi:hypothetical protein